MTQNLIDFFSQYISLEPSGIEIIANLKIFRELKKGTLLLKEGEFSTQCFLVLKGCVRSYYLVDGEEKTTDFFTEGQPIVPISYTQKKPSEYYISCIEDCLLSVGSDESSQTVVLQIPKLKELISKFNQQLFTQSQLKFEQYFTLSPQDRYLTLLETRPDLCQRVPQYMLASYLGIKPESLSRIRKRMISQNKTIS